MHAREPGQPGPIAGARRPPAAPRAAAGRIFAVVSALGYGASLPLSRLAFDEGTNALTVALLRYLALSLVLLGWVVLTRHARTALSGRERSFSLLLGGCFALVSFTVLVFYTHPSLILLVAALLERRRPRGSELLVLAMAFAGLVLALDVRFAGASTAGLACAGVAAVGALVTFVLIEHGLAAADPVRSTSLAAIAATAVCLLAVLGTGGYAAPATAKGWLLVWAVIVLFATAVVCMFLAIRFAGSVRASMLLFLEPVTAMALSVAALGERLAALQWAGAALVIAAVALAGARASVAKDHPL
jgi:drug/metabolite transporter (DMT)-like permease